MTRNSDPRRPTFGLLAVLSGVLLASCQTSADEVLSLGETAPSEEVSAPSSSGKAFRDPYVVAMSGQAAGASDASPPQKETDPARLKRKPVPLAAAYSDIAEPPPEVLALQQQAGQAQPAGQPPAPANLGELTMQPTTVAAGSNSLFSASQRVQPAAAIDPPATQMATAEASARGSLVPSEMPTLGVNAVRKSLFSPSPEQTMLMQQQALQDQAPAATESLPLTDPVTASTEEPVLKKLSDPRPKRKMLALRETATEMPERVQLTPDQLQALGAVEEADPAEPLSAEELMADVEAVKKKKAWLPSLSDMLKGGKKKSPDMSTP
ncbi:MAG: hypothetical protein KJ755_17590 [Alphaproteobacteria bacterium]|nr:hypothetical protein [Alphaproteobacteria bacterium]